MQVGLITEMGDLSKANLMKCASCGHWNSVPVNKIFIEQSSSDPKVKGYALLYEPLYVSNNYKNGKVVVS